MSSFSSVCVCVCVRIVNVECFTAPVAVMVDADLREIIGQFDPNYGFLKIHLSTSV